MSIDSSVAVRFLDAIWPDGSKHDVTIEIARPYADGNSYRCAVRITGLMQGHSPADISGYDEIQAITLSLKIVRTFLELHLRDGGKLYYPNSSEPYTPDDLPG